MRNPIANESLRRIGKLNQLKRIVCQTQPIYIKVVRRHGYLILDLLNIHGHSIAYILKHAAES